MARSNGAWARDSHLQQLVAHTLYSPESLAFMGFRGEAGLDQSELAQQVLSLTWHLLMRRAWSMAKYSAPPDAYARVGSDNPQRSQKAVDTMRQDWADLVDLEQQALRCPEANDLLRDIHFAAWAPIRLLFMFFERDKWRSDSLAGRKLLFGLLYALPDSKIVEDPYLPKLCLLDELCAARRRAILPPNEPLFSCAQNGHPMSHCFPVQFPHP